MAGVDGRGKKIRKKRPAPTSSMGKKSERTSKRSWSHEEHAPHGDRRRMQAETLQGIALRREMPPLGEEKTKFAAQRIPSHLYAVRKNQRWD